MIPSGRPARATRPEAPAAGPRPLPLRVFCLLNGGIETASARERFLRYLPDLARAGIELDVHVAGDVAQGWRGRAAYWGGLLRRLRRADGVLIHRVPLSATERALVRHAGPPAIVDVDDAVWYAVEPDADGNPLSSRRAQDLRATLHLARWVRVGNDELAAYVGSLGLPVRVAPTCVRLGPPPEPREGPFTIGWIGQSGTLPYLDACAEAVRRLARERPVRLRVVADRPPRLEGVPVEFEPWSLERETALLRSFDVGVMPLPDTPWARGKCGYKILLYMAHGLPVVASPVGVNARLVEDGVTGFLARTTEEWHAALRSLVDHPRRRAGMGAAARATIEGRYDHEAGLETLRRDLRDAFRPRGRPSRRRVTMLLFAHPPMGGSAAYRNSAFALRLRDRGWEPRVICVGRWPTYFRDATIAHVPGAVRVHAPDLGRWGVVPGLRSLLSWFVFPDRAMLWAAAALAPALRAARGSAAVFSTSPPESAHLLAWAVKRLTGRPWIADHSNEWADNPIRTDPPARIALHRAVERFALRSADRILTLSPHHTRLLRASYPRPDRVETAWTGWDPAEATPSTLRPRGDRAVVLFAGTFYGIQRPDPFLDAAEGAGLTNVEFHVLGDAWDSTPRIRSAGIPAKFLGRVSRAEALRRMRDADFLLITLTERASGVVPGKMFEYAAAGRPILAVVPPDGEVARWVRETRTGFIVTDAAELRDLFARWRDGRLAFSPDPRALARYAAPAVADQLDRIVREATSR